MRTFSLQSLLAGTPRMCSLLGTQKRLFYLWLKLLSSAGQDNPDTESAFLAGYTLGTNVILRENFLKKFEEIERKD